MHLVTIDDVAGGSPGARLRSGAVLHLGRAARSGTIESWVPRRVLDILEGGDEAIDLVRRIVDRAEEGAATDELFHRGAILAPDARLLAPVPEPRMVVAAGLAYKSHLAEMSGTPTPPHPTAFMKSAASIASPHGILPLPAQASDALDYEGELACVFGRACHAVSPEDAMACVAGFTVANDLSARDWVKPVWAATAPWEARLTWEVNVMGKQFPGFTPLGPALVTADEIEDVTALGLTTRLNGTIMQQAPIGDMIFSIAEVIAHLSRWYQFRPGDVLLTGTPAGVGVGRSPPVFLKAGDVIEVQIERIGLISTRIASPVPDTH